jgi:hypothetical protein
MNRRSFFTRLASGLVVMASPSIFIPKLIKPCWKSNLLTDAELIQIILNPEAFAAYIGPVIKQVCIAAGTANRIYSDIDFNEKDCPSIPLDLFYERTISERLG